MEVDNLLEETEPGVTVVEEDEGSVTPQIFPALSTFRYLLTFEEGEIMYLLASLAVLEEEIDKWRRGVMGKVQTAYIHHLFPDHLGGFPASIWTGASVSRVTRTSILRLGFGIPRRTKSRRRQRRGVLTGGSSQCCPCL